MKKHGLLYLRMLGATVLIGLTAGVARENSKLRCLNVALANRYITLSHRANELSSSAHEQQSAVQRARWDAVLVAQEWRTLAEFQPRPTADGDHSASPDATLYRTALTDCVVPYESLSVADHLTIGDRDPIRSVFYRHAGGALSVGWYSKPLTKEVRPLAEGLFEGVVKQRVCTLRYVKQRLESSRVFTTHKEAREVGALEFGTGNMLLRKVDGGWALIDLRELREDPEYRETQDWINFVRVELTEYNLGPLVSQTPE